MRAKSHDQRKGQWLINKIRFADNFPIPTQEQIYSHDLDWFIGYEKRIIELRLWNMENNEFDEYMKDYNK